MNLGLYQQDGVVLDLAPHDLSILLHWLGKPLVEVTANGRSVFQDGVHETAFLTLRFEGGTQANVQLSWLAPRKMRQMVVVGSQQMVQYEDTAADDSVRIYDRGLDFSEPPANFGEYRLTYRTGDMVAPRIEPAEPLGLELQDFASAIREGTTPVSNARLGLEVVFALDAGLGGELVEQLLRHHVRNHHGDGLSLDRLGRAAARARITAARAAAAGCRCEGEEQEQRGDCEALESFHCAILRSGWTEYNSPRPPIRSTR